MNLKHACDVGSSLFGVVLGRGEKFDLRLGLGYFLDEVSKVLASRINNDHTQYRLIITCLHFELLRVAKVHWLRVVSVHEFNQTVHEIIDILERSSLLAVAVNCDILSLQRLNDEVAHHTTIVGMHSRSEGVEDSSNSHFNTTLLLIRIHHRLRHSLPCSKRNY